MRLSLKTASAQVCAPTEKVRTLKPDGRQVPESRDFIPLTINTNCPAKWALVDLETGDIWGHDGKEFRRITRKVAAEVAVIAENLAGSQEN